MPENEFEKQVKELMEGLHFSPSEPVWEKIKKGIAEKKRRIWPVIFLFIAIAFFGGYWFYNSAKSTKTVSSYKQPGKIKTEKTLSNNNKQEINTAEKNTNLQGQSLLKNKTEINKPVIAESNNKKENRNAEVSEPLIKEKNKNIFSLKNSNINSESPKSNATIENNASIQNKNNEITSAPNLKNSIADEQSAKENNAGNINVTDQGKIDSINNNNTEIVKSITDTSVKTNTVVTNAKNSRSQKISQSKNHKWLFGISAMYGSSNITSNLVTLNKNKSLSSGLTGQVSNNPGVEQSPYETHPAYNLGITVQRKIFKNSYIVSGLNFVHLSSKSYTALKFDSSMVLVAPAAYATFSPTTVNLYRAGSEKTYIDKFNFIELPLSFQSNIFHIKNFGLLYNAGFSVMHLLSSKSLIYDSRSGSYFTNDDLLRRTQFQLTGGLNFELNTNHTGTFLLGPQFKYSLSNDVKDKDYNHFHFINYGIQASWLFHKK